MTTDELTAALNACAAGLYPLEAGVGLLIAEGSFLRRDDFTGRFIEYGASSGATMAAIDWDAVITALHVGELALLRQANGMSSMLSCQPRRRHPGRPPRRRRPALTTATSSDWSPRSCTRPGNGPTPRGY